uniref:Uncharacterized protein MANES_06G064900 n=1 Tax=Rhizophora mucronata TaxID=61149 RepID=A0A2P2KZY2_RHIMU
MYLGNVSFFLFIQVRNHIENIKSFGLAFYGSWCFDHGSVLPVQMQVNAQCFTL